MGNTGIRPGYELVGDTVHGGRRRVPFFGDHAGALSAADAATGKVLWSYPFTDIPHSSPMTYVFDGKQFVAMTNGTQVYAFGLPE